MTAWTMGFKIPNLSRRLFGEGAASSSFIPVYSESLHREPQNAQRLANTVLTVLLVVLAAITVLGETAVWIYARFFADAYGAQVGLRLCAIMMPYMIAICLAAILAGVLNVRKHFAVPASAPIVLNLCIIASILLTGEWLQMPAEKQVYLVALTVLAAGLLQISMHFIVLRQKGFRFRLTWDIRSPAFGKIITLMLPMIVGLTVTQINTLLDDLIALGFASEQGYPVSYGAVGQLYFAQRLYQFPLGVLGISLATAIFPVMSADAARNDLDALRKTISRGIKASFFVALPATAGLWIIALPLTRVLFEHGRFQSEDTPNVAFTLACYAFGLTGYFIQQISIRAFYAMQESKWPARTAAIAVGVNLTLNFILIWFMGTAGLALSTAVCSYLQIVILLKYLRRRFDGKITDRLKQNLLKTLAATAVMTLVALMILIGCAKLPQSRMNDIITITLIVIVAAAVYLFAAKLLKNEMLPLITGSKGIKQ